MRPKREHATNYGQTYMVTTETSSRRAIFRAEPWARLLIETLYHYRGSAYLLHARQAARLKAPLQNRTEPRESTDAAAPQGQAPTDLETADGAPNTLLFQSRNTTKDVA